MKQKHTKAEKAAYMKDLRQQWQDVKKQLTEGKIKEIQAIIATHGLKISTTGFMFCAVQMKRQGLEGLPYLDAKTFKGWKENGFTVRKGEHSTLKGITWVGVGGKETDDTETNFDYMIPRQYHLFHRSQVSASGRQDQTGELFAMTA